MPCIAVFSQKGFLEMPLNKFSFISIIQNKFTNVNCRMNFINHFFKNINHENCLGIGINLLVHKISILKKEELTALLRNRPHDESI